VRVHRAVRDVAGVSGLTVEASRDQLATSIAPHVGAVVRTAGGVPGSVSRPV